MSAFLILRLHNRMHIFNHHSLDLHQTLSEENNRKMSPQNFSAVRIKIVTIYRPISDHIDSKIQFFINAKNIKN
jgi:hypothetical protein